jgi:hypothetical protein
MKKLSTIEKMINSAFPELETRIENQTVKVYGYVNLRFPESPEVFQMPVIDLYTDDLTESFYIMGTEKHFHAWLEKNDLWSEPENPEILSIYNSDF